MRVINECRIDYDYKMNPLSPIITKTIFSNSVETIVSNDVIKVEKLVNKKVASSFDILEYTVLITNISDKTVTNIFFQDFLPREIRFIKNSVNIDGKKRNCISVIKGFFIDNLKCGKTSKIEFKAMVLQKHCSILIKNHGSFKYDFIYNVEKPPARLEKDTNEALTKINNNLFKQFIITDEFCLGCCNERFLDIKCLEVHINIIKVKLAKTIIKSVNCKNEKSKLINLIFLGAIEYRMKVDIGNKCYRYCKIIKETRGFSISMLVPSGVEFNLEKDLHIVVKNVSYSILVDGNIVVSTLVLIKL